MMKRILGAIVLSGVFALCALAEVPSAEVQIAGAVMAAPAELRDGAAVLGYSPSGERVMLRKGSNEMFCLASDPARENFNVACYQRSRSVHGARAGTDRAEDHGRETK